MENSSNLLQSLINASEKASNIARICRSNKKLLSLLIQEKTGPEANARFQHDFKTLADVLIQETIKHDIGTLFSNMCDGIKGEESPSFTTTDGKTISIEIGENITETAACLSAIMQDVVYQEAAEALAIEVHRNVQYKGNELGEIPDFPVNIDYSNLGVWIDPIDATAEYIAGGTKATNFNGISSGGLECVTVLIGVYTRDSGIPILGVISQPFFEVAEDNAYKSRIVWGVSLPDLKAHNVSSIVLNPRDKPLCICSSSEQVSILNTLNNAGYETIFSAGSGYKSLKVILHDADIYLLSKGSTFKWDTCAPQAILRALNGNIYNYYESIKHTNPIALKYIDEMDDAKCNQGGIIAVYDRKIMQNLLLHLKKNFE